MIVRLVKVVLKENTDRILREREEACGLIGKA